MTGYGRGEAEGDSRKEIKRRGLLFPIVLGGMIHISDAGADRVEGLKWANERAGRKNLDVDASCGRGANPLRQTSCACLKTRAPGNPGSHRWPTILH